MRGIRTRHGGHTTSETAVTDFTVQTCGAAAIRTLRDVSEEEGRVLAGGLSFLRMEAAAVVASLR